MKELSNASDAAVGEAPVGMAAVEDYPPGSHITSLEMAGCSVTLRKLDDELTAFRDAPINTSGLRWGV